MKGRNSLSICNGNNYDGSEDIPYNNYDGSEDIPYKGV